MGTKNFNPIKNVTDIAVVYIDMPKIIKVNMPSRRPFSTSLKATINDATKMSVKTNMFSGYWYYQSLRAKLSFLV